MSSLFDIVLFATGPIYALFGATFGYKTYRKFEFIANITLAVILLFWPDPLIKLMLKTPQFDYYHRFLSGLYGVYFLHGAFYTFMLRDTKDETVFHGHIWSRIIEAALVILDSFFVYFEGNHWNYRIICFLSSFAMTVLIINSYFLTKIKKPNSTSSDTLTNYVNLEFFGFLLFGIFMYAFPDTFCVGLSSSNESYRSLTRAVGANVIAASFQTFFVSSFAFNDDKKSYFLSRLIVNQAELILIICGIFVSNSFYWFLLVNLPFDLMLFYALAILPLEEKSKTN